MLARLTFRITGGRHGGRQRDAIPEAEARRQGGALEASDRGGTTVTMHYPYALDVEGAPAVERAGRDVIEIAGTGFAEQARASKHCRGGVPQSQRRNENHGKREKGRA